MSTEQYRSDNAGALRIADVGRIVQLAGWIDRRRDHGGVVFVDLRDASGLIQVVFNPDSYPNDEQTISELRLEYCITVTGTIRERPEGTRNPNVITGEIEVVAESLMILGSSAPLPFQLNDRSDTEEIRRLEHRYLDLRTERMQRNLQARALTARAMRHTLEGMGFLEVETPTLISSTPEGARDMLVPSRLRPGTFYALPQSPQLFKQLLMIGGVERYYQIARCYRDEDFRSDRQLEFTQLDIEGAFWTQNDVLEAVEKIITAVVRDVRGIELTTPFPRISYADALERYGSDKPDARFGMEIRDLSQLFAGTDFRAFAGVLSAGGAVRGINAGAMNLRRSALDALIDRAHELGAKGLVWVVVQDDGSLRSPVTKHLSEEEQTAMVSALEANPNDLLLIVAGPQKLVESVLGQLRLDLGIPKGHQELSFLFVVDFPVFETTDEGDLVPAHHPFTAPVDIEELRSHPETALSRSYDLVLNGSELGSGSVRIHDPEIQAEIFEILGIAPEEAYTRFGWFLEALKYGTPPHAGIAIGMDRLISILQEEPNIREVIPFPKTQSGADPLTGSPARVADLQLKELGIELDPEVRKAWEDEPS